MLPETSSVKHAMIGSASSEPDSSDSEPSTRSSSDERAKPVKKDKETRPSRIGDPDESPDDSSDSSDSESSDFGSDFLAIEPESDHDSDSASVKRVKRAARRKYRAKDG